eukprot:10262316-Alexandrium_andersonii.AAC.1
MSASLVGSEMCIRDSLLALPSWTLAETAKLLRGRTSRADHGRNSASSPAPDRRNRQPHCAP